MFLSIFSGHRWLELLPNYVLRFWSGISLSHETSLAEKMPKISEDILHSIRLKYLSLLILMVLIISLLLYIIRYGSENTCVSNKEIKNNFHYRLKNKRNLVLPKPITVLKYNKKFNKRTIKDITYFYYSNILFKVPIVWILCLLLYFLSQSRLILVATVS